MLKLIAENELPKAHEIIDVPLDNPLHVYKTCLELQEICEKEGGIGISAVQVGLPWKLFIIKDAGQYEYFVNCEYIPTITAKRIVSLEGCLSIRSPEGHLRHFEVERWNQIEVSGKTLSVTKEICFKDFSLTCDSLPKVIVLQHEADHSSDILINKIGKEIFIY